ncbi:hypothetical protein RDI58_022217 [Solanum bulbocastanum]|uniref:Uncharacterized protein n=1 Tax=Solanum bulbocastanum TaxID=147425 RepID=A0AAN8T1N2_SOLBU
MPKYMSYACLFNFLKLNIQTNSRTLGLLVSVTSLIRLSPKS